MPYSSPGTGCTCHWAITHIWDRRYSADLDTCWQSRTQLSAISLVHGWRTYPMSASGCHLSSCQSQRLSTGDKISTLLAIVIIYYTNPGRESLRTFVGFQWWCFPTRSVWAFIVLCIVSVCAWAGVRLGRW